jgi:hypothetical protein
MSAVGGIPRSPHPPLCEDDAVPAPRGPNPIGLFLMAFEIWRRLPPAQRRRLTAMARRQGPRVAAAAFAYWQARLRASKR